MKRSIDHRNIAGALLAATGAFGFVRYALILCRYSSNLPRPVELATALLAHQASTVLLLSVFVLLTGIGVFLHKPCAVVLGYVTGVLFIMSGPPLTGIPGVILGAYTIYAIWQSGGRVQRKSFCCAVVIMLAFLGTILLKALAFML
ncbi:MAG: hypothetical protein PHO92_00285 [Candidatus Peribacteraceae bacterium]|nr:hypothetical protein [Candidatus Peribacteraceae bacterium]